MLSRCTTDLMIVIFKNNKFLKRCLMVQNFSKTENRIHLF